MSTLFTPMSTSPVTHTQSIASYAISLALIIVVEQLIVYIVLIMHAF